MRASSLAWLPTFWLGTVSWVLFVVLLLSGLPLMVFYIPSVEDAYRSVKDIEHVVSFGWWLRAVHRLGAHVMVIDRDAAPRARVRHRRLQELRPTGRAAGMELGDWRRDAGRHAAAVVHRLPAAVGSAWRSGRSPSARASCPRRPSLGRCCARRSSAGATSARRRWSGSICSTSSCCRSPRPCCSATTCGASARTAGSRAARPSTRPPTS